VPFDPFDREYLLLHFEAQGADFGASTPEEYEAMADRFLLGPRSGGTRECVRPRPVSRVICRYRDTTEEYGVKREIGWIVTYFKPDPSVHGYASNLEYYRERCK
jgi:pyocin large subunit-like protein